MKFITDGLPKYALEQKRRQERRIKALAIVHLVVDGAKCLGTLAVIMFVVYGYMALGSESTIKAISGWLGINF